MTKSILAFILCLSFGAGVTAQAPTRLFDVRNGSPAATNTLIVFKDAASKDAVIDAFAERYSYPANVSDPANPGQTIPNPQSKNQFFMQQITRYLRDVVRASRVESAALNARKTAEATADSDLPPQ